MMLLRRLYRDGSPVGVQVLRAGPRQNFAPSFVEAATAEGWLSLQRDRLTIHAVDGDLVYTIDRTPGFYCCHCGRRLGDGPAAHDHVALEHPGKPSPDPANPSGYRHDAFYACTRLGSAPKPAERGWLGRLLGR